jgi:hypothetical protein
LIKRRALRASAFHFLFRAEGRVTPGRRERLGVGRGMLRGGGTAFVTCGRPCRMNRSIDLSIPRQHGRVTPGRAAAMGWVPGMVPAPGRSRMSTARSRVLRVYERRLRDPVAPTELRGTPSEGVYDFGVGRWGLLGVGSLGRWALGVRQGHPRGADRRRGHFTAASIERSEAPSVCTAMVCSPLRQVQRRASCGRALGVGCLGVGRLGVGRLGVGRTAGSPPGAAPEGRWVALPPPLSRRPGSYTSPRPRRRRP